jgi:predicted ABC-type transport system involved in lysophospholipase L1 biosynthesis ATPase subunit
MESSSALVIVTHDISLADRCDQKIELIDGKVL